MVSSFTKPIFFLPLFLYNISLKQYFAKCSLDFNYPIGRIIATADSRNPSTYLGGTWVAIQNRTIVGVGTHALDWTDGSETHAHTMNTHKHALTSAYGCMTMGSDKWIYYRYKSLGSYQWTTNWCMGATSSSYAYNSGRDSGMVISGTTDNQTSTMQNASSLQPSVAKYLWQRTA